MDAAALGPLIERMAAERGIHLPPSAIFQLATHLAMTLHWATAINLTTIREPEDAVRRHVLESLQAASHLAPAAGGLLDVGSGNGYPALPARCLHPALEITLLEPALRRSIFLESVVRAAGLEGVVIRRERVERPRDLRRYTRIGNISMRGVNAMRAVLVGGADVLPAGGRLVLLLGRGNAEQIARSAPAGLRVVTNEAVPHQREGRILVLKREPRGSSKDE